MSINSTDKQLVTIVLIVLGAVVVLPVLFMGFGMIGGFGPMTGGMWGDGTVPGWMVLTGGLMQLLFLAAIVGAGYLVYRAVTTADGGTDQALEELRLAYARGDLRAPCASPRITSSVRGLPPDSMKLGRKIPVDDTLGVI